MKSNKKNMLVIILILVILILLAIAGLVFAYATTDFLKTDEQLFKKYFSQNIESLEELFDTTQIKQIDNEIKNNNHESSTLIKISDKIEDSSDYSELARISIETVKDNASGKNQKYSDIKINSEDLKAEVEYMYQKDQLSIRLTDLVKQYLTVENRDLRKFASNLLGISENDLSSIPNKIDFEDYTIDEFTFSEEEIKQLKQKYFEMIGNDISKDHYSKQKNKMVTVNNNPIYTTEYSLKLTDVEIYEEIQKVLENLKSEEIVLNKLSKIQNKIGNEVDLKEEYAEALEKEISALKKNVEKLKESSETNEIKILVNVENGKTVRVRAEDKNGYLTMETVKTNELIGTDIKFVSSREDNQDSATVSISRKLNNNFNLSIEFKLAQNDEESTQTASIEIGKDENNNIIRNFMSSTENLQISFKNDIIITDHIEFDDINTVGNIVLNDLDAETLQNIMDLIGEQAQETYDFENNEFIQDIANAMMAGAVYNVYLNTNDYPTLVDVEGSGIQDAENMDTSNNLFE
ncbi:MAG: hypothetical protein IJV31_08910 [Clostridia bacterium]|nr:hypothetical protein [Clostridia bacterium]